MQDARMGAARRESHAPVEVLDSLRQLNHRFLDLLASTPVEWGASVRGLPSAVFAQMAPLSPAQKNAASGCPYALFDLNFRDPVHWRSRLHGGDAARVADAVPVDDDILEFMRLALFFAWHVAVTAKFAAPLLLDMHDDTIEAFRGAALDRLPSLAVSEARHLTARWSHCTTYWRMLTGAASKTNAANLRRIQLYGLQLAAVARLTEGRPPAMGREP